MSNFLVWASVRYSIIQQCVTFARTSSDSFVLQVWYCYWRYCRQAVLVIDFELLMVKSIFRSPCSVSIVFLILFLFIYNFSFFFILFGSHHVRFSLFIMYVCVSIFVDKSEQAHSIIIPMYKLIFLANIRPSFIDSQKIHLRIHSGLIFPFKFISQKPGKLKFCSLYIG